MSDTTITNLRDLRYAAACALTRRLTDLGVYFPVGGQPVVSVRWIDRPEGNRVEVTATWSHLHEDPIQRLIVNGSTSLYVSDWREFLVHRLTVHGTAEVTGDEFGPVAFSTRFDGVPLWGDDDEALPWPVHRVRSARIGRPHLVR